MWLAVTRAASKPVLLALAALFGTLLASCAAVFGLQDLTDLEDASPASHDAASANEAGGEEEAGPRSLCVRDFQPPPPQRGVPRSYYFALSELRLGPREGEILGLDLDCTETVDRASSSCQLDPGTTDQYLEGIVRDLPNGVDNAAAPLFFGAEAKADGLFNLARLSERVRQGVVGLVFAIDNVDSFENDNAVAVEPYPARSVLQYGRGACPQPPPRVDGGAPDASAPDGGAPDASAPGSDAADAGIPPIEVGEDELRILSSADVWCRDDDFVEGSVSSKQSADRAWIRDGHLVVHFPRISVPLVDESHLEYMVYLTLDDAWLVAGIDPTPGAARLTGATLTGRWQLEELFRTVALVTSQAPDGAPCAPSEIIFPGAQLQLCGASDLSAAGFEPNQPCKAISVAIGFEAYEVATVGGRTDTLTYDKKCNALAAANGLPPPDFGLTCPWPPIDEGAPDAAEAN